MHRRTLLARALVWPCTAGCLWSLATAAEVPPAPPWVGGPLKPHPLVLPTQAKEADLVVRAEATGLVAEGPRHLSDQFRVLEVYQEGHQVRAGDKILASRRPADPAPRSGEYTLYLQRTPGGGWTKAPGDAGLSHVAAQSTALRVGELEFRTVASPVWTARPDGETEPFVLGVRVSNPGKDLAKVSTHTCQLWVSLGDQAARRVVASRNGLGKPVVHELPPGGTLLLLVEEAKVAMIGNPPYLALTGRGFMRGDWLELPVGKLTPGEIGVSIEVGDHKRTDEVRAMVRLPEPAKQRASGDN